MDTEPETNLTCPSGVPPSMKVIVPSPGNGLTLAVSTTTVWPNRIGFAELVSITLVRMSTGVTSVTVLLAIEISPAPETMAVLIIVVGALAATFTVRVIGR